MSKSSSSKLALDQIVSVKASAPAAAAAVTKPPYSLEIFGPTQAAMQQLAIHVRAGYTPSLDLPIDVWSAPGYIKITLVRGNPDASFVVAAEATIADAVALEEATYRKDVAAEAARQIQAKIDADAAAQRAQLLAAQKAQLAQLEQQIKALSAATSV